MFLYRIYVTLSKGQGDPPDSDSLHAKSYLRMDLNWSHLPKFDQQFPLSTLTCQVHPFIYPSQSQSPKKLFDFPLGRGKHLRWIESSFFGQLKPGFQASPDSPPPQKKWRFPGDDSGDDFFQTKITFCFLVYYQKNSTAVD